MMVTDIIFNFRSAVVAILPMVEAVGISWKRGDAYDPWDDLVTGIYKQLVVFTLSFVYGKNEDAFVNLPAYDGIPVDYRQHATIEVQNSALGSGRWVFHALSNENALFDCIIVRELTFDGVPLGDLRSCPLVGSQFTLRLPDGSSVDQVPLEDRSLW